MMYAAICSDDERAFANKSEESDKKNFIVKKSLRPVPSQGIVEQAKKTWQLQTPARIPKKRLKTSDSKVADDPLMKDMIK